MAQQYPYPESEHYMFPQDPLGVIADELHYHPDAKSFRQDIVGIGRMYEAKPLLHCLKKYAALARAALVITGEASDAQNDTTDFYAGELLALHALVSTLSRPVQRQVLSRDILEPYYDGPEAFSAGDETLGEIITGLAAYQQQEWHELFELQHPAHRSLIVRAAERAYADVPAGTHASRFIAGYLHTGRVIAISPAR